MVESVDIQADLCALVEASVEGTALGDWVEASHRKVSEREQTLLVTNEAAEKMAALEGLVHSLKRKLSSVASYVAKEAVTEEVRIPPVCRSAWPPATRC